MSASFFLLRILPGSPFDQDRAIAPEIKANLERQYGLDKPLSHQYFKYIQGAIKGDLGPSLKYTSRSVQDIIGAALPISLTLGFFALVLSLAVGLSAGIAAALKPRSIIGSTVLTLATLAMSLPSFVMAALLVTVFALKLHWLPVALLEGPEYFILPLITLSLAPTAYIIRITRSALLETLGQDYIRTALAKGLSNREVLIKHALRNSLIPILTVVGPLAAILITGSFVVEYVFAIPGMGKYFVTAFINRDYFLVSGVVLVFALILLIINMLVELSFPLLNPKLKS